jgi:hypothetical protein
MINFQENTAAFHVFSGLLHTFDTSTCVRDITLRTSHDKTFDDYKKFKALFYPMLPGLRKGIAFDKVPRLHLFALLVPDTDDY